MALNLSALTSPATSGNILEEVTTTADFLENVPVFRNLSRGSNKGGDAKQSVALNQPRSLPLIKNPQGKLGGYLYIPDASGNYATGPSVTIGSNETWQGELDMVVTQWGSYIMPMGCGDWTAGFGLLFYPSGYVRMFCKGVYGTSSFSGVTLGTPFNVKYGFDGTDIFVDIDGVRKFGVAASSQSTSITHPLQLAQNNNLSSVGNYAIQKAKLTVNSAVVFDCDFNGSTSIRHGDTKFQAAVGGPVSLTKAGNDPVTVVKNSVLRFANKSDNTTGICLQGLLNQTITDGYMFAAFSVLGDGGEGTSRIFSVNNTGGSDGDSQSAIFSLRDSSVPNDLFSYQAGWILGHSQMFDDDNGDLLHESLIKNGTQKSLVNNAGLTNSTVTASAISSEEFNIVSNATGLSNAAIDLEFLALFPASITDAQADSVRNYINNRNNVFSLIESQGYYFYNAQSAPVGAITTGSSSWNGRIVGSDLGDSDRYLTQGTTNDAPVGDGFKVTFADNTDHLDIPQVTQAGWQVVGTSLGTFAYRVDNDAVTELNLLGNLGNASYRKAGDLYGIILLPESATGADIEEARSLLINRGAADGATSNSFYTYWSNRYDIVEFNHINTSSVTSMSNAWFNCQALSKFPLIDTSSVTSFNYTFYNTNLESFPAIQAPLCTEFTNTWQNCSSLTSFPAGAKLGTSAQNVNFGAAFMNSGLTSFPALDLSSGDNFSNTFRGTAITQFPSGALLGTAETNVNFNSAFRSSNIISFSTPLPTGNTFADSFKYCDDLTDVSVDVFTNWNPLSIANACFNDTWKFCTALTAQSVENILTSIDASGQHATSDGDAYVNGVNTQLADSGIDIDYNVATGSLSAATNTAIDSLSGKGWEVFINGVLVIPNILDLAPAAAYSLRSFDADADPNVVNVRRSSDNATSDFKASEVTDGTLTTWVNTDVDFVTPTLNNGDFEDGLTGWGFWSASADTNEFYAGTQSAKITVIGGGGAYIYKNNFSLQAGANYRVGFWAKISDASKQARVEFGSASNKEDISFTSTDWEYKEVTKTATAVTLAFNRQTGSGDYTINIDNVTVTQLTADGHVTTWYDQGGTNHAAQSDDAKQPKIVDGGTLVTDGSGNPAIIGDGVNDTLFHPTLTQSLDNTDFLVTAAYKNSLALGVSGGVPRLYMTQGAWSYNNLSSITFSNQSGRNVLSFQTNGDAQEVFGNGTSLGTGSEAQANFAFNGFNLMQAGSGFSNGFFMEVVVFDENQVSNRTGIENNINDTYTIY